MAGPAAGDRPRRRAPAGRDLRRTQALRGLASRQSQRHRGDRLDYRALLRRSAASRLRHRRPRNISPPCWSSDARPGGRRAGAPTTPQPGGRSRLARCLLAGLSRPDRAAASDPSRASQSHPRPSCRRATWAGTVPRHRAAPPTTAGPGAMPSTWSRPRSRGCIRIPATHATSIFSIASFGTAMICSTTAPGICSTATPVSSTSALQTGTRCLGAGQRLGFRRSCAFARTPAALVSRVAASTSQLFREMSRALLAAQHSDGLWRPRVCLIPARVQSARPAPAA